MIGRTVEFLINFIIHEAEVLTKGLPRSKASGFISDVVEEITEGQHHIIRKIMVYI